MGSLWHNCVAVLAPIEVSFGVMSGVVPGIGVLDGDPHPQGEGKVLRIFLVHWFEWIFIVCLQNKNVLNSCVKSLQYFRMDNIPIELLLNVVFKMYYITRSTLEFMRNMLKCNSDFRKKSHFAATLQRVV